MSKRILKGSAIVLCGVCFQVSASVDVVKPVEAPAGVAVNLVQTEAAPLVKESLAKAAAPVAVAEKDVESVAAPVVVATGVKENAHAYASELPPMTPAMRELAEKMYRDNQMILEEMRHIRQAMKMRVQRNINKGLSREMAFMKGRLEITQGQEELWSGYVEALQMGTEAVVAFREKMHEQRIGSKAPPTSIERLNAQVGKLEMQLASLKRVAAAASQLYTSLSVKQQATADHLFRRHKKQLSR